jgi:transcriptional regulator with XRE-family HTH domain
MLFNSKALLEVISGNIRKHRLARDWSQQKLAEQSDISRRMVQMIESGKNNISLSTVCRIADAFEITFHDLVSDLAPNGGFLSEVREHGIQLWHGASPGTEANLLGNFLSDPSVEVWEWTFALGERYRPEPILQGTKELIYVVEGELTLEHENRTRILKAWDSITFPSDRRHVLVNSGRGLLRLIWMFTITRSKPTPGVTAIKRNDTGAAPQTPRYLGDRRLSRPPRDRPEGSGSSCRTSRRPRMPRRNVRGTASG